MTTLLYSARKIGGPPSLFDLGATVKVQGKVFVLNAQGINKWVDSFKNKDKTIEYLTEINKALKPGIQIVQAEDGSVYICSGYKEL